MSSIFPISVKRQNVTLLCSAASRCGSVVESTRLLKLIDRDHSRSMHLVGNLLPKNRKLINKSPGDYSTNLYSLAITNINARRPINGSINAGFRLVFLKKKNTQRNCVWLFFSGPNHVILKSFDPHPPMTSSAKKLKPKNAQIFV